MMTMTRTKVEVSKSGAAASLKWNSQVRGSSCVIRCLTDEDPAHDPAKDLEIEEN